MLTRAENVAVVIREAVAIQIRIEEAGGSAGADVHEEVTAAADGAVGQDRIRLGQVEQQVGSVDDMEAARVHFGHATREAVGQRRAQD